MSQSNGYRNRLVHGRGFDADRDYVHQEYPKWVTGELVHSEDEEKALLGEPEAPAPKSDDLE